MLPPALGGLRVCVPPVPGHPAPGSMSKITTLGDCPSECHNYTTNPPERAENFLATLPLAAALI